MVTPTTPTSAALSFSTDRAPSPSPADQKICRQAAHMYEVGASDGQIDAYLSQLRSADDQQTFLAAYAALEAGTEEPRETPYEVPASEDTIWEAEAAYQDQVRQERHGAYALADAELSGYDPVHERHLALTADQARRVARALPNVYTPAALLEATRDWLH